MKKMLWNRHLLKAVILTTVFSSLIFAQNLKISPDELELTVGDSVQLTVSYVDTNDVETDTSAVWMVDPHQVATVNNKGLLVAKVEGAGVVIATLGEFSDTIDINVDPVDDETLLPAVQIVQGDVDMYAGDSLQYTVVYIDTNYAETDTMGIWTLRPDSLGSIDTASGLFVAERPGEGLIEVHVGDLMAWVYVSIFPAGTEDDPADSLNFCDYILLPRDTIIAIGEQVQYVVYEKAEDGSVGLQLDTTFTWSLDGMPVGTLSQSGLLDVSATGYAIVKAELDDKSASALVIVQDSTVDMDLNKITITRDSPNTQGYSVMQELTEGEIWTLGGLPYPMNVLNGGQIYFPIGSLTEDIRIHISLPQFADIRKDSVGWAQEGILAGVDFTVMVNDTISEPYYFETPLIVGLVYKRGLLDKLGIDPYSLSMYFAVMGEDSVLFDSTGITATTVDPLFNRIFSGVAHFSSLAIVGETDITSIDDAYVPSEYSLEQNYPNPFNPITSFSYTLPDAQYVNVTIYDLAGRQVETLINGYQTAGHYSIRWNASSYSSGIYFYRLNAGTFTATKKMILMK